MRRFPALLLALVLASGAAPAGAQAPAAEECSIKIAAAQPTPGEPGQMRLGVDVEARVPERSVVRLTLTLEGQVVAVTTLVKGTPDQPLHADLGPFPGLLPGVYAVTPQLVPQDQDPALVAAHPEIAKARAVALNVRIGDAKAELERRAAFRSEYARTAHAFHDLWLGLWHRAEWSISSLRCLKFSKPARLSDEKRSAAALAWKSYVEGEFIGRERESEKALQVLVQGCKVVYDPDVRNTLVGVGGVLRRARAVYWRTLSPLIGEKVPADADTEGGAPLASLAHNAADAFRALDQALGPDAGCGWLPPIPIHPDDVRVSAHGPDKTASWEGIDARLRLPEGWEGDFIPGIYPTIARFRSLAHAPWAAEFGLYLDARIAGAPDVTARVQADARGTAAEPKDFAVLDPGLQSATGRELLLHGYTAADGRHVFQLSEVDAKAGRALWLRLSGPDVTAEELQALAKALGWPSVVPPPAPADPKNPPAGEKKNEAH